MSSQAEISSASSSSGETGKEKGKEGDEDKQLVEKEQQRQEKVRHLQSEAFMLANYYFVFQGVIFTAIYGAPSELKCRYRWFPVALSSLAGSINFFAILEIAWKYKIISDAADKDSVPKTGPKFIVVECRKFLRWVYFSVCASTFLAFLVVTLVACWYMTCDKDRVPPPAPSHAIGVYS